MNARPKRHAPLASRASVAAFALPLLVACGSTAEQEPASFDAGTPDDAAPFSPDAARDAASELDGARPDAAALRDGGARDASTDAAPNRDAATPADAGTRDAATPADAGSSLSPLCQGAATAPFQPPATCDALSGNTTTSRPSNAIYATSWFGCYRNAAGTLVTDPYDNCEFACGSRGLCASGLSGPECQAQLKWFAADADRFGCGTRIKVTNCSNGRAVVLAALDRGPNCRSVEQAYGAPVMDMSWPAMTYLFEGRTYGGSDKKRVVAEVVPATTSLGPVN
jgi:hypothetical protein